MRPSGTLARRKKGRAQQQFDGELVLVKTELGMVKWIVSGVGLGVIPLVLRSFWPG